jgi:hypothetical protein
MIYHNVFVLLVGIESRPQVKVMAPIIQQTTAIIWHAFHVKQIPLGQLQLWEKKDACNVLPMKQLMVEKIRLDVHVYQGLSETTNLPPQDVSHVMREHIANHASMVKQTALQRGCK